MEFQKGTGSSDLLFVYGTLKSGFDGPYARQLRQHATLLGTATTAGELYLLSWYPGLVLGNEEKQVHGELYRVLDKSLWPILDEYEGVDPQTNVGSEYEKRLIMVHSKSKDLLAWAYVCNRPVGGELIPDGRFSSQKI